MTRDSSLILVMEHAHKRQISALAPAARGKIFRLCEQANLDVGDPFGKSENDYRGALTLIEQGVDAWTTEINANPHE